MLNNPTFFFISFIISVTIAYCSMCHYVMTKEELYKKDWFVCNVIYISIIIGYLLLWLSSLVVFIHKKLELEWKDSIDHVIAFIKPEQRLSMLVLFVFVLIIAFLSYPSAPLLSTQNLEHRYENIENDSGELKRHNIIVYFGCVSVFLLIIMYLVVY